MLDIENKQGIAFWTLNAVGWALLMAVDVFIEREAPGFNGIMWSATRHACGFLVCIPLRYIYSRAFRRTQNIWHLGALVLVCCFVATNVWNAMKSVTYIPFDVWDEGPGAAWGYYFFAGKGYILAVYHAMWVFFLWSILYFAGKITIEWWLQKRRLEEAALLAQNAQIKMLRYQMNPHFLFNSLNSIRSIVSEDPGAARAMISDLAGFLRYSLLIGDKRDAPLHSEMEAVSNYLAIEKRRFEENLDVVIDVSPAANVALIPCFIVQPLVENAIKHGRQTSRLPLRVRIKCTHDGERLVIRVSNTGALSNKSGAEQAGTGTGLENVRKRLHNAYPGRHHFALYEKDGWVTAQIEIADAPKEGV